MGAAVSKDGVLTKVVEAVPGGGLITAPFHAAAGNTQHATSAAVNGVVSATSAATGRFDVAALATSLKFR